MKYGPLVFLAAFFALSASWCALVLAPQVQLGRAQPATPNGTTDLYPTARPGLARQGLEVYRANGCVYCHSQQIRQTGAECNVILTDIGTNPVAAAAALLNANVGAAKVSPPSLAAGLPKVVAHGLSVGAAIAANKILEASGAKTKVDVIALGPDIGWDWGKRRSLAQDFLYDDPVMLGSQRVGPDLANVALRLPDENWQLVHLYAPRALVKNSAMPSYRFLFEQRPIGARPSPDALRLPKDSGLPEGIEVVPKPEARALAAYLLSLRSTAPLFEAPMTPPPAPAATTNAPAK